MDNSNERPLGWTTLEESEQLIKAGLSIETADMCYSHIIRGGADSYDANPEPCSSLDYPYEMPCWSLGELMSLLPLSIQVEEGFLNKYYLDFRISEESKSKKLYMVTYCISQSWDGVINTGKHETFIEACVEMVCWLLEHKLI